jgi:hypothetical protein
MSLHMQRSLQKCLAIVEIDFTAAIALAAFATPGLSLLA